MYFRLSHSTLSCQQQPTYAHILSHVKPGHILETHFFKIHPDTILPSTPRSPKWFLQLDLSFTSLTPCP
jgi:hypothetical protein